MKMPQCLFGAAAAAMIAGWGSAAAQEAEEETVRKVPFEFAVLMSDYVSKRNKALAEFDRIYLKKFADLKTKYEQQNQAGAVAAVRNKMIQLQKEIERLEAATGSGFVLLEATYGSEEQSVECLEPLLGQIRDDRLRITVKPAAMGVKDPHRGVRKTLTVKYLWNDEVRVGKAMDGQLMELPEEDKKP